MCILLIFLEQTYISIIILVIIDKTAHTMALNIPVVWHWLGMEKTENRSTGVVWFCDINVLFMTHATHFIYGYMALDIW